MLVIELDLSGSLLTTGRNYMQRLVSDCEALLVGADEQLAAVLLTWLKLQRLVALGKETGLGRH